MQYNKLVRDRIPQIIRETGEEPVIRILSKAEYIIHLERKLDEEVSEYHHDHNAEELADILEVLFALAATHGVSEEELLRIRRKKRDLRGGFEDKVFLISKEKTLCTE